MGTGATPLDEFVTILVLVEAPLQYSVNLNKNKEINVTILVLVEAPLQ